MSNRTPRSDAISEVTANRLSVYLRCLSVLENDRTTTISSQEFARRFHLNSAQIRKDLATFGGFGIRGVGYDVAMLKTHLVGILGLDRTRSVTIVGAGHLGQALADYGGFNSGGFRIVALFDIDKGKIGTETRSGVPVYDLPCLPEIVCRHQVEIGVITVPAAAAQEVCERLVRAGVKAILNFAPVQLAAPQEVRLKNVDLKISLETLSFYLKGT